ncbi:MAG: hypothetical protein ACOYJL_03865 [Tractidigestivibacter sp.]|jgi:hypothetical protein|uniref:hypothetical protein n=1 Tax=Tractidigestivibacter sp. TaxID=2847320 RepID=UPI003D945379
MAYSDRDRRPQGPSDQRRRTDGRPRDSRQQRNRSGNGQRSYNNDPRGYNRQRRRSGSNIHGSVTSSGTRQARARGGGKTDYQLHSHSIGFSGGRNGFDYRLVIIVGVAIIAILLIILSISSCVRANSEQQAAEEAAQQETRVASGISDDLTAALNTRLDQDDKIAEIAKNADQYDERMVQLALDEPTAIDLVAGYLTSDKTAEAYGEAATEGSYPQLYCWDSRWGDVDYADSALAVTGSGPTVASMAYMGLTGNNDKSPADMAALATEDGVVSGDSNMDGSFFATESSDLGITYHSYDVTTENIQTVLSEGAVIAVQMKADTLTSEEHWILIVENTDQGLVIHDPTSTEVSSKTWSASDIASYTDGSFYALTKTSS